MEIDVVLTAAFGVVAAFLTFLTAWLSSKKKEAIAQGDMILAAFSKMTDIAQKLAVVFPSIKAEADVLKDMYDKFFQGWNDKAFTTEQMQALYTDAAVMLAEIQKKVAALQG